MMNYARYNDRSSHEKSDEMCSAVLFVCSVYAVYGAAGTVYGIETEMCDRRQ